MSSKKKISCVSSSDGDSDGDSDVGSDGDSQIDVSGVVDEDTKNIEELCDQVYKYDSLSENEKLKNIEEFNRLKSAITEREKVLSNYRSMLEEMDKKNTKPKNVTTKMYNKCYNEFLELKQSDTNNMSIGEILVVLEKLKKINPSIKTYLDKQLEIINH